MYRRNHYLEALVYETKRDALAVRNQAHNIHNLAYEQLYSVWSDLSSVLCIVNRGSFARFLLGLEVYGLYLEGLDTGCHQNFECTHED
jgi:hypothetical protein